jgi:hypothetical protein
VSEACPPPSSAGKIDKSLLTISEPKRIRSKEHLRFVAQHPVSFVERSPSHAHHIRFAQSRGLGLKVSDEFTYHYAPLSTEHVVPGKDPSAVDVE